MGSTLSCLGAPVWTFGLADLFAVAFRALALANHGASESFCPQDMTADDIVRTAFRVEDVYDKTITGREAAGYVEGRTRFLYPYDRRRSVETASAGLFTKIDEVIAETGSPKVDILAHSQGGRVTRVALASNPSIGKVSRVLTMATPFCGAAKLLSVALTGKPCVPSEVYIPLGFVHIPFCPTGAASVEEVVRTLPRVFELLPSPSYFSAVAPTILANGQPSRSRHTSRSSTRSSPR